MLVKIVIVFLAAMAGIAMLSNMLFPGRLAALMGRRKRPALSGKCSACGRPKIGKGPCPCGKG